MKKHTYKAFLVLFLLGFLGIFVCSSSLASDRVRLLVPGTPSSIPLIIAANNVENIDVKVVHNLAQAHASFIRGDADLVLTGLSVGMKFFEQGLPVKIIASHISSLSYLVYNTDKIKKVEHFKDLVGEKIWFPFPGSPLEEVSKYFIKQEGLELGSDIEAGYGDFQSSVKMLQAGKRAVIVLPEPFVSLATKSPNIKVGVNFSKRWQEYNESSYPQVALIGKPEWLEQNKELIKQFKIALEESINGCQADPETAITLTKEYFSLPEEVLISALLRTQFELLTDDELRTSVFSYYKTIGKTLDEQQYKQLF